MLGCKALDEENKQVDGEVVDGDGMNLGKEVNCSPGEKKSGGKLLEKFDLDFVARVVVLHNKCRTSAKKCGTNKNQRSTKRESEEEHKQSR